MTGINGKINKTNENIVLFDNSISIEEINSIRNNKNSLIFATDFASFSTLKNNNIKQQSFDEFLTSEEMSKIQKLSYELSDWYSKKQLSNNLLYENVNLGSLLQSEFINILVNFLKKFFTIYKISLKYKNYQFISSKNLSSLLENLSLDYTLLNSSKIDDTLPLDSLNTNIDLKFKNINFKLKIGTKKINSIRSLTENISNSLIKSKIRNNSQFILFSELNTKKFSHLLQKMPNFNETYVVYNRRQPSIWDKESFQLFKNSEAILENEKSLKSNKKSFFSKEKSKIDDIIIKVRTEEEFFEQLFSIEKISFWPSFQKIFFNLIEKRFLDYSYEIFLSQKLLNKYSFSAIMLQNEVGPNERILLQIGKAKKIPIILMQHGLIFDTDEAFTMNKYQGVLGLNTDYQLVWGDVDYNYRKNLGLHSQKIKKIGNPIYDNISEKIISEKNYILLATSGPTTEDIFDLNIETITKNIDTIKKISQIISKLNQKLIIKIHPSPDEFDPSELVKSIDPNIQVIKTGNISQLIQNCSLMIVIDFSSVILDAHLLKKPVINIPVKNNGYGTPTAFSNDSCLMENLESLENSIKNTLENDNVNLLDNSKISSQSYLSNLGNASENLLKFLSDMKNAV
ncbi:MAG: hypothetical protein CL763_09625 [Chloroflexi bacterium]|nr:hypothetical protein [Chloroflexota bacterium]MBL77164.1 hypothetical protein [Chloroflexota bacterium]|tara:strand:+ start:25520 stop:27397 length:1878 start_codon:yes stop_codon:yes gene_type:complete